MRSLKYAIFIFWVFNLFLGTGIYAKKKFKKPEVLMIQNFEQGTIWNSLGNRSGPFQHSPSTCFVDLGEHKTGIKGNKSGAGHYLILNYEKKESGGPGDTGGWCGWYTILKLEDNVYLNLSKYNYLRFYFKPVNKKEKFVVGMADKKWDLIEDSVHIQDPVEDYITKEYKTGWKEVTIPLADFEGLDLKKMASFAVIFEPSKGTVFLDNISVGYDEEYDAESYYGE